jgi:hypothetical protein
VVYENVSYEQATENMIKYFSKTQHAKKDKINETEMIAQKDEFHDIFTPIALEFSELFEEFIEAVLNLKNVRKAVVTSNTNDIVLPLLGDLAEEFEFILDYHDHLSKETKIEQICKEWGVSEKDAYYFTDTIADVVELDQYMDPTKILGCSWGFLGKEKLQTVLPDNQILDNFDDIYKHFPENYKGIQKNKTFRIKRKKRYILLDSVGIRRPGQRTFGAEDFATYRTIQTAHEADVLCLVLDGSDTVTHQDQVVGGILQQSAKGVVIVVNKSDLAEEDQKKKFVRNFANKFVKKLNGKIVNIGCLILTECLEIHLNSSCKHFLKPKKSLVPRQLSSKSYAVKNLISKTLTQITPKKKKRNFKNTSEKFTKTTQFRYLMRLLVFWKT